MHACVHMHISQGQADLVSMARPFPGRCVHACMHVLTCTHARPHARMHVCTHARTMHTCTHGLLTMASLPSPLFGRRVSAHQGASQPSPSDQHMHCLQPGVPRPYIRGQGHLMPHLMPHVLPTAYCLLPTAYFLLPTRSPHASSHVSPSPHALPTSYFLLPTSYFLLPTSYFLLARLMPRQPASCLLPTSYCLLPTTYCLLPTAYFLLPTRSPHASSTRELATKPPFMSTDPPNLRSSSPLLVGAPRAWPSRRRRRGEAIRSLHPLHPTPQVPAHLPPCTPATLHPAPCTLHPIRSLSTRRPIGLEGSSTWPSRCPARRRSTRR